MSLYTIPLSRRTERMKSSAIREMLKHLSVPGMISLAGGNPAPESFPTALFQELLERTLTRHGHHALQYSETEGFAPLRTSLSGWLQKQGIPADPSNLLVTNGSQGALDALAKVLLDSGTPIAVESPTYLGALQAFMPFNPSFHTLTSDEQGVLPESLEAYWQQHPEGIAYLMPTFQNPSGRTMSLLRRQQIAALLQRSSGLMIEDDPYSALRFDGSPLPALISLCPEKVVYLGTLSKVFAPGMRIGFCIAPAQLFPWLVKAKQGTDLHTSTLAQALASEYVNSGSLDLQIPKILSLYRTRRDAMQQALAMHFPSCFTWSRPEGGMFFWLQGPPGFDAQQMLPCALQAKVAYVAGNAFSPHADADCLRSLRLNFTLPNEDQISQGIARLANIFGKA